MAPTFKDFISYVEKEGLPKDKGKVKYVIDKSFILAWMEGTDDSSKATKVFVDLLGFIKKNKISLGDIFLPVDSLLELKNTDKKKYIDSPDFITMINSLFKLITVNPDVNYEQETSAVKDLAEAYSNKGYSVIILTLTPGKYASKPNKIHVKKPEDILVLVAFFCSMFEPLGKLYSGWFENGVV